MANNVVQTNEVKKRRDDIKTSAAKELIKQILQSSTGNSDAAVVQKLGTLISSKEISHQERIEGLTLIQTSLLSPMLGGLFAQDLDFQEKDRIRLAKDVYYIIDSIIKNEYTRADHAEREIIDFRHPKIQMSYKYLIEVFIESLKEAEVDQTLIQHIISRLSSSLLAFEDILASKFHNVANSAAEMVDNPLLDIFKDREIIFRKYQEDLEKGNVERVEDNTSEETTEDVVNDSPFGDLPSAEDIPDFPSIEVLESQKDEEDDDVAIVPVFVKEEDSVDDILPPNFISRDL